VAQLRSRLEFFKKGSFEMEISNPLILKYRVKVEETIRLVCAIQTIVALVVGVLWWKIQDYFGPGLGAIAILFSLVSIPSVATIGINRLKRYERDGWKKDQPNLDFSGTWDIKVRFLKAFKVSLLETKPPEQRGRSKIHQSALGLVTISQTIETIPESVKLGTVDVLSSLISADGRRLYTVYKMNGFLEEEHKGMRSQSYGFGEISVNDIEALKPGKQPSSLQTIWYDCVHSESNEQTVFIGETTYTRPLAAEEHLSVSQANRA
jgi:hypothetical protein